MSRLLSLIFFDVGDSLIAISADSVSSFIPLEVYSRDFPSSDLVDFMLASGIQTETSSLTERFVMVVNNSDGTESRYLTPPPGELVEYSLDDLYPLPEIIERVSSVSNLSGYCLHKGIMAPILLPIVGA